MNIGKRGLDLIKSFEGLELKAYFDVGGVPTIGYGHTRTVTSLDVKQGRKITPAIADQLLFEDVQSAEEAVNSGLEVEVNQAQFDALVCFTYNVGNSAFLKSTLLQKLNREDILGAADQFLRWNKAGGKVVSGLTRRRKAERDLFLADLR